MAVFSQTQANGTAQQICALTFDQGWQLKAPIQMAISLMLLMACALSNTAALHFFQRHRVRPELSLFVFAVTFCNCLMPTIAAIGFVASIRVDWYLYAGHLGCGIIIGSTLAVVTLTNWLWAATAIERLLTIKGQSFLACCDVPRGSYYSLPGLRWGTVIRLIPGLFLLNVLLWTYPFGCLGLGRTSSLEGDPYYRAYKCTLVSLPTRPPSYLVLMCAQLVLSVFMPIIINAGCYIRMLFVVRAYWQSRNPLTKKCFDANRQARMAFKREVCVAKITAVSYVSFLLLNLPFMIVMGCALALSPMNSANMDKLSPTAFMLATYASPILTPFLQSLIVHCHSKLRKRSVVRLLIKPESTEYSTEGG